MNSARFPQLSLDVEREKRVACELDWTALTGLQRRLDVVHLRPHQLMVQLHGAPPEQGRALFWFRSNHPSIHAHYYIYGADVGGETVRS